MDVGQHGGVSETLWKGDWWLPDMPDDVRHGTLHYADDGTLRLELLGGFDAGALALGVQSPSPDSYDTRFPVIHGRCGSELFTLLDAMPGRTLSDLFGHVREQDINAMRGLRGIHIAGPHDSVFDSVSVQLEYLLGWTARTSMHASATLKDLRWTGEQKAHSLPLDDLKAVHDGITVTLSVVHTQFRVDDDPRGNQRSLTTREWAELTLARDKPVSLDDFSWTIKAMADLMTFCAHAPSGVLAHTLSFQTSDPRSGMRHGEAEVMGRQVYTPTPSTAASGIVEYLFTLNDVAFEDVVPAWLVLHRKASTACGALFGLKYISQGYVGSRLLSAASSAEAMHKSLRGGKANFHSRVAAIAAIPDQKAVGALIPDVEAWVTLLKRARNSVAHAEYGSQGSEGLADRASLQHTLAEVTYALLSLVLMAELGISAQVQQRATSVTAFVYAALNYARDSSAT